MQKDWLDEMVNEVTKTDGSFFYKQAADENTKKVHKYLSETYPKETLEWVNEAEWKKEKVPLEEIKMDRRPGGAREQDKVKNIAKAFKNGEKMEPVVLVRTPEGKLKVADGYHRTLGCKHAEEGGIDSWVGTIDVNEGPWDKEMHEKKLNKGTMQKVAMLPMLGAAGKLGANILKSTGKSVKSFGTGITGSGTKAAKKNLNEVKLNPDSTKLDLKGAKKDLRGEQFNRAKSFGVVGAIGAGAGMNEMAKNVQKQNEQLPQLTLPKYNQYKG